MLEFDNFTTQVLSKHVPCAFTIGMCELTLNHPHSGNIKLGWNETVPLLSAKLSYYNNHKSYLRIESTYLKYESTDEDLI